MKGGERGGKVRGEERGRVGLDVDINNMKEGKGEGGGEGEMRVIYLLLLIKRGREKRGGWQEGMVRGYNNRRIEGKKGCHDLPVIVVATTIMTVVAVTIMIAIE